VFDWLFEGWWFIYALLGAAFAVVAFQWARDGFVVFQRERVTKGGKETRRRLAVLPIVLAVLALLVGVYFLLDRLVETRREEIKRKLKEMAAAVRTRDLDRIFSHISEQFQVEDKDKAVFRRYVEDRFRLVDELAVWGEAFPDDTGTVTFHAKPKGSQVPEQLQVVVRAQFVRDPDGQWRLRTFELFLPPGGQPVSLP
jgi:hypothetical protein